MRARRTHQAHEVVAGVVKPGDCAVDATVGNGHDTLFLAQCVGAQGQVFGFDVQPAALAATRRRLLAHRRDHAPAALADVVLFEASHADMAEHIPASLHGKVTSIMFNLGYLPGTDHAITTSVDSTLVAIEAAGRLLAADGVMSVLSYPGHPAGREELHHLLALMEKNSGRMLWHEHDPRAAPESAPRLFIGRIDR